MIPDSARPLILESLRVGCDLASACRGAKVPLPEARALLASDPSWCAAVNEALAEGERASREAWATVAKESAEKAAPVVAHKTEPSGPWAKMHAEARERAPGPMGYFLLVDARCVAAGMPSTSPFWLYSVKGLYDSEKAWGIFDIGRGGGKSTTLEKFTSERSLFATRHVPPGQVWTWPFISIGPDDANRRITGIAAVYRALGLVVIGDENTEGGKHREGIKMLRAPRGSLELVDAGGNAIQLASIAGTIGNVSGPSTIGMTIDEAAKLHDKTTNANPLTEIIASGAQTSRARRGWRAIVSSSAWETSGAHYQLIEQGDNESNFIAKIGEPFLAEAVAGFESVAAWEAAGGPGRNPNPDAAARIRAHARSLTAASPMIPTWLANPTLGHPDALPWDGAALASRKLVQALPEGALGGIPRELFWLRENGSVPMSGGAATARRWTMEDWTAHREAMRGITGGRFDPGEDRLSGLTGLPIASAPSRYRPL